jgi:4-hydroxy-tetrahydrodipicolinate reductase
MKIRVLVSGATGWVGGPLSQAINQSPDMQLVGAMAADRIGENLGDVLQDPTINVCIVDRLEGSAVPGDVFVDFTSPAAVKNNVITAINRGMFVVIGTSGLSDEDYADIGALAKQKNVGVIAAGNYSITAVLMQRFAIIASEYISSWEIIDYASAQKPDAPSGTARELAYCLGEVRRPIIANPIDQTMGAKEARGTTLHGMQVHSVRLPGYILSTEILFGMPGEKLVIRHEADNSPQPYIAGVLLAIRSVRQYCGLIRGLNKLME